MADTTPVVTTDPAAVKLNLLASSLSSLSSSFNVISFFLFFFFFFLESDIISCVFLVDVDVGIDFDS